MVNVGVNKLKWVVFPFTMAGCLIIESSWGSLERPLDIPLHLQQHDLPFGSRALCRVDGLRRLVISVYVLLPFSELNAILSCEGRTNEQTMWHDGGPPKYRQLSSREENCE